MGDGLAASDAGAVRRVTEAVLANVGRAILGKQDEIKLCLIALLGHGHLLIEDVPGVGKTTLAKSLARSLDLTFRRIQFTPDLLPSDLTGVRVFNQKSGEFEFRAGPIFAQVLLADEVNRATPKTQSALLEAMEEKQVTIDGETHDLLRPFLVMATQNPVEHAGTFPLPESQLDRFMMKVRLGYLKASQEAALLGLDKVESPMQELQPVVSPGELSAAQAMSAAVFVREEVKQYIARIVERTRNHADIALGASTRGTLHLFRAAQARAAIEGRGYVIPDDVKALAVSVLAHRLILRPSAEAQGESAARLIAHLLQSERVPQMAHER